MGAVSGMATCTIRVQNQTTSSGSMGSVMGKVRPTYRLRVLDPDRQAPRPFYQPAVQEV